MKALRAKLLLELETQLKPLGFRKRDQSYYKEAEAVRLAFHVAFINHPGDFDVIADVAVRHHAVEERLNANRTHLKEKEKQNTFTVGAELGNIDGIGQKRWTIVSADDIPPTVGDVMLWFNRVGVPFLSKYSRLEGLHQALSEDGPAAMLICPFPDVRAEVRSTVAALVAANAS